MSSPVMSWWFPSRLRKRPSGLHPEMVATDTTTDEKDLAALGSGESEALEAVYRHHGKTVFRFAYSLTASREAAEETTQEVFLFLLKEWRRYDSSRGSLEAWLLGITRRMARKLSPTQFSVPLGGDAAGIAPEQAESSEVLEKLLRREEQVRLHQAIAALPEAYRDALVMHALLGLSYEQVSQQLGCPLGTVRSRIARAKQVLARQLREHGSASGARAGATPLDHVQEPPAGMRKGASHVR